MEEKMNQSDKQNTSGSNLPPKQKRPNLGHTILKIVLIAALLYGIVWYADYNKKYGPAATPDRLLLNITEDPATAAAFTWRASLMAGGGKLEIVPAFPGPEVPENVQQVSADREFFFSLSGPAWYYTAIVDSLTPDTQYMYRVGSNGKYSPWAWFTTAPAEGSAFTFLYLGDVQNDILDRAARVIRRAHKDAADAAFTLYGGDLINRTKDGEFGQFYAAHEFIHQTVPIAPVPGNHEYDNGKICRHWRPTFELPGNGPEKAKELAYYFDYLNARFICLDTNFDHAPQARWLENLLSQTPEGKWIILYFHHPIYSAANDRDNKSLRDLFQPIFDRYNVDLVLQGHDHAYGRTGFTQYQDAKLADIVDTNPSSGPVYLVSVAGPKMYDLSAPPVMHVAASNLQLYQVITIDGDSLTCESKTADGEVFDAFTIQKNGPAGKTLLEHTRPEKTRQSSDE